MHSIADTTNKKSGPIKNTRPVRSLALASLGVCALLRLAAVGASAGSPLMVPNSERLFAEGHLWYDVGSATTRPGPHRNSFGTSYDANPSWAALCPLDSDGDGFTNGEELGDPDCVWKPGATPSRTTDLSHPGLYGSVPLEAFPGRVPLARACSRDADGVATDNRVALRSPTLAAPSSIRRLDRTWQVAQYRLPPSTPDMSGGFVLPENRSACPHLQGGLLDWHDPNTWPGGAVPAPLTNVTLPANSRVLVSSCSLDPRGYLAVTVPVGSKLIFADAPIFLRVKDVRVMGELLLGSAACPLHSPVTISFVGEKAEGAFTNGLTAMGSGAFRLHGTRNAVTWTRLAATVLPGTAHVLLQTAVPWGPGDEIVVATSIYKDLAEDQNEVRTVVAVSADGMTLVVDRPFAFRHWAGLEYQTEVGLLTRSVMLRGGLTASQRADRYGGHTMAHGPGAVSEVVGVRAQRMGQQNVLGRYSFHLHLAINGSASTLQQSTCDGAYYRCVSVHKTNRTLVRMNVAYNVSANCYYLEDGSEMYNRIEYNLAVRVLILGKPASGAAQGGEVFLEDPNVAIQPADHAAAGFYISNPHNYVVGNAASGGWAGFAFPIFPYAQRLSSDIAINPSSYPVLEFDGNTAHSAGYYWGDAGCVYFGGKLTDEGGVFKYTNGRFTHPTDGMHNVTNLRTWLCNRGLSSWGERVELSSYEAHDVKRSAVLFGQSSIHNMIVSGNTANMPLDMLAEGRQGFGFYDTWVRTSVTNTTFINFWNRNRPQYDRDAVIVDLDHSDIYKPWYISATRNLRMVNVDNNLRLGRWVRETGASRMFNLVDWDGSLVGLDTCSATIIGSEIDWWNGGEDCWYNANWPAWLCPRKPGREVVGLDVDLPGIQRELDIRTDDTNQLTPAQRQQLYIGHVSQFGNKSHRRLTVTRNKHFATGLSGLGWYVYLATGVPKVIKLYPINFATTGTWVLLAISYPAGTNFDVWVVPRWNNYRTRFIRANSRQEVLDGNGTYYHFDGRHLYVKVADMWSKYPNTYSRDGVQIPNVAEEQVDVVVTATGCAENADGFCATPAEPDPPADLDFVVRECDDPAEQTRPIEPIDLCPHLTDVLPPPIVDASASNFASCSAYTEKWNVWRCSSYDLARQGYCAASCNDACRVYNPYPPRCSFMEPCAATDYPAPRRDTCGEMNDKPLSDECSLRTCNVSDHGNYGNVRLVPGTPCNYNAGLGDGMCDGSGACVRRSVPNASLPLAVRLTDRSSVRVLGRVVEVSVSNNAAVTGATAYAQSAPNGAAGQGFAMSQVPQGGEATSAGVAVYRVELPFVPRRNVTIVLRTALQPPNDELTYLFSDWNAASNVVPSFGDPNVSAEGVLSVAIDPIDWVTSAVLVNGRAEGAQRVALTRRAVGVRVGSWCNLRGRRGLVCRADAGDWCGGPAQPAVPAAIDGRHGVSHSSPHGAINAAVSCRIVYRWVPKLVV